VAARPGLARPPQNPLRLNEVLYDVVCRRVGLFPKAFFLKESFLQKFPFLKKNKTYTGILIFKVVLALFFVFVMSSVISGLDLGAAKFYLSCGPVPRPSLPKELKVQSCRL
jgi:hypothetical protein